jgi:hypothetical protein
MATVSVGTWSARNRSLLLSFFISWFTSSLLSLLPSLPKRHLALSARKTADKRETPSRSFPILITLHRNSAEQYQHQPPTPNY